MDYPSVFHLLSATLPEAGIRSLLIGGFAVNYHGASRQTADVDFLLIDEDYPGVKRILERHGYHETDRRDLFARLKSDDILLMDVDFLFVDPKTFERMWAAGIETTVAGGRLRVPSLDHLLALKIHALKNNPGPHRHKDILDIVALAAANKVDLRAGHFHELCLRFGSDELYSMLLRHAEEGK